MAPRGWYTKYAQILAEFRYSRSGDEAAARRLDILLHGRSALSLLNKTISSKDVFVVGAGPSLDAGIKIMERLPNLVRVVADSAVSELVRHKMRIDVIVSDLDGNQNSLCKAARSGTIMVIHAHADNTDKLEMVCDFPKVIGTTQSRPIGKICNFGGFTDGDRCVFVASAMHAKSITLLGMNFGSKVGKHSMTHASHITIKRKKLQRAKALLEWIAPQISKTTTLYTASGYVLGFEHTSQSNLMYMFE